MGPRPHSLAVATLTAVADPADDAAREPATAARRPSPAARRASAPYAHKTRGYYRTLSATSVGLEMAVAVTVPLLVGIWLDGKAGTSPWLMLLCLCFGFAAGVRAVWRYVAESDRDVRESEEERGAPPGSGSDDDARGGP
jgi:F0F1-type ATP synthase assembly protein I